jgi:hypothetical protein
VMVDVIINVVNTNNLYIDDINIDDNIIVM